VDSPLALEDVVDEEVARDPLAHEPSLLVGEDHQDGVDVAALDKALDGFDVEPSLLHGRA